MATVNLAVDNDADLNKNFSYKVGGVPVDLSGDRLRMGIRRRASDNNAVLLLTTENGGLAITDPVNGAFTLTITDDQLLLMNGSYAQSLVRITPDNRQLLIWNGSLVVSQGSSRGPLPTTEIPILPPTVVRLGTGVATGATAASATARSVVGIGVASCTGVATATSGTKLTSKGAASSTSVVSGVGLYKITAQGAASCRGVLDAVVGNKGRAIGSTGASAIGGSLFAGQGAASSVGTANAVIIGIGKGAAMGAGSTSGSSAVKIVAQGVAACVGSASSVPQTGPVGRASSTSVVSGIGASKAVSQGAALGTGAAAATSVVKGTGAAAATGAASAVGTSKISSQGVATCVGTATATVQAAAITQIQFVTANTITSGASKGATGAAIGVGNCIVGTVSWQAANTTGLTSVTDDKGNAYTVVDVIADAGNQQTLVTFIKWNVTNAPSTITANFNASYNIVDIEWSEYSGVLTTDPRDGHAINLQSAVVGTDAATSGNLTTTIANDLIWSVCVDTHGSGTDYTAGTGYVRRGKWLGNYGAVEDKTLAVAGTTAATFTVAASTAMATAAIALKRGAAVPTIVTAAGSASGFGFASTGPSGLRVSSGKIYDPAGNIWTGKGIAITEDLVATHGATLWTKVKSFYPGITAIRIANYAMQTPANYASFVTAATADGVYIVFENHVTPPTVLTGAALTAESNWYASMAAYYLSNPRVMYGTMNEPGASDYLQMQATYNAVRGTGYNGILFIEAGQGANGDPATLGSTTFTNAMTNIAWDIHCYNWESGYSTNVTTITNDQNARIAAMQTVHSADGTIPVACWEMGNSTDGVNIDAGATQQIQASFGNANFSVMIAWCWTDYIGSSNADNIAYPSYPSGAVLTSYGTQLQPYLAASTAAFVDDVGVTAFIDDVSETNFTSDP